LTRRPQPCYKTGSKRIDMSTIPTRNPWKRKVLGDFAEDREHAIPGDVFLSDCPPEVAEAIKEAFLKTGCMDLYGGRAADYVKVLGSTVERLFQTRTTLEKRIGQAQRILDGDDDD
jgi:hypothetical protein